jgi:hypothetical protein
MVCPFLPFPHFSGLVSRDEGTCLPQGMKTRTYKQDTVQVETDPEKPQKIKKTQTIKACRILPDPNMQV